MRALRRYAKGFAFHASLDWSYQLTRPFDRVGESPAIPAGTPGAASRHTRSRVFCSLTYRVLYDCCLGYAASSCRFAVAPEECDGSPRRVASLGKLTTKLLLLWRQRVRVEGPNTDHFDCSSPPRHSILRLYYGALLHFLFLLVPVVLASVCHQSMYQTRLFKL